MSYFGETKTPISEQVVGFGFDSSVYRDPVHFPRLTAIVRKRLFEAARIRRNVRYDKPNEDGTAIQCFLIEKLTASILKLANRGYTQSADGAVGEVQTPLAGFGVI